MATVSEIKRRIVSERDVHCNWYDDLKGASKTMPILEQFPGRMLERGGRAALEALAAGELVASPEPLAINTHPFGVPTKELFSEFLGVCVGTQKLSGLFSAINRQIDRWRNQSEGQKDTRYEFKSDNNKYLTTITDKYERESDNNRYVTIITDKWDDKFLQKNEVKFLNAILKLKVIFNFYLVDDYGITRIPFMNREQRERFQRDFQGEEIIPERDMDVEMLRDKSLPVSIVLRNINITRASYTLTANTSLDYYKLTYEFDFPSNICTCTDDKGRKKEYSIKEESAREFALAALEMTKSKAVMPPVKATNGYFGDLEFSGAKYIWRSEVEQASHSMNENNYPKAVRMLAALEAMIDDLQLKYFQNS